MDICGQTRFWSSAVRSMIVSLGFVLLSSRGSSAQELQIYGCRSAVVQVVVGSCTTSTFTYTKFAIVIMAATWAEGRDFTLWVHTLDPENVMAGKGMTCWDYRELCDLNCVFSVTHAGIQTLSQCGDDCITAQEECTDGTETLAYVACATDCALTYDSSLTKCNQQISNETKGTYGTNQDACANIASGIMDDCMEACYGSDRFDGWTPDTEEGTHLKEFEDEIWRHPFRAKSTVYGRLRGDHSS